MKINNLTNAISKLGRNSHATSNKLELLTGTINKLERRNNVTFLLDVEGLRKKGNKCEFQVCQCMPKIILQEKERIFKWIFELFFISIGCTCCCDVSSYSLFICCFFYRLYYLFIPSRIKFADTVKTPSCHLSLWHDKSRVNQLPSIWYCKIWCLNMVIPLTPILNCKEDNSDPWRETPLFEHNCPQHNLALDLNGMTWLI